VFFAKAVFGTGTAIAVLESSKYNIAESVCLMFQYQISSSKINLTFQASTSAESEFVIYGTWTFADQSVTGTWNKASVLLPNGVTRWKFIATKAGFTIDSSYAALDNIDFNDSCVDLNPRDGMYEPYTNLLSFNKGLDKFLYLCKKLQI